MCTQGLTFCKHPWIPNNGSKPNKLRDNLCTVSVCADQVLKPL